MGLTTKTCEGFCRPSPAQKLRFSGMGPSFAEYSGVRVSQRWKEQHLFRMQPHVPRVFRARLFILIIVLQLLRRNGSHMYCRLFVLREMHLGTASRARSTNITVRKMPLNATVLPVRLLSETKTLSRPASGRKRQDRKYVMWSTHSRKRLGTLTKKVLIIISSRVIKKR